MKVLVCVLAFLAASAFAQTWEWDGHVTHGSNTYYGDMIVDWEPFSFFWHGATANPIGPIWEIGVYDSTPGATNSTEIYPNVDDTLPIATANCWNLFLFFNGNLGLQPDLSLVNIPTEQVGTNYVGSTSFDDRIAPVDFSQGRRDNTYRRYYPGRRQKNLREFNQCGGKLTVTCDEQGAHSTFVMRNGWPRMLYTLWDCGTLAAKTANEAGYCIGFGGAPNFFVTDENGDAYFEARSPYCTATPCQGNGDDCTLYLSLYMHFDHMMYGASWDAQGDGFPVGVTGANHLQFFLNGEVFIQPQNPLDDDDIEPSSSSAAAILPFFGLVAALMAFLL